VSEVVLEELHEAECVRLIAPGGEREHFISITPARITGRRIRRRPA
jgi:hypothetical protein